MKTMVDNICIDSLWNEPSGTLTRLLGIDDTQFALSQFTIEFIGIGSDTLKRLCTARYCGSCNPILLGVSKREMSNE
jgi:hypothetical protein